MPLDIVCLPSKDPGTSYIKKKNENKVIFLTPAGFNSKNTESCGAGVCWEVFQGIMEQYLRKTCFILGELGRIFPV